jgi:hypothetical protein
MPTPKEPSFLAENQSVVTLVSQLHHYFSNTYSQFETEHGTIVSQFNAADEAQKQELMQRLRQLEAEMTFFGALSDALSVADRLLHARSLIKDLDGDSGVYTVHHEAGDHETGHHETTGHESTHHETYHPN